MGRDKGYNSLLRSAHSQEELGDIGRIHPGASESESYGYLISVSSLQNSEVICFCCFKPPSLNYLLWKQIPEASWRRGF